MVTHISRSPEETKKLGSDVAEKASHGMVVGLVGDLGAGKTQFVKGFAEGLGISERVHSPTFTLVNEYRGGRLPLYHLDLYRLETMDQVRAAGLEEYLPPGQGVAIVEWFDRLEQEFTTPKLHLITLRTRGENEREILHENPRA